MSIFHGVNSARLGNISFNTCEWCNCCLVSRRKVEIFCLFIRSICSLSTSCNSFPKALSKIKNISFFDPEKDPLGAGYQIIQSKIAIGSGGIFGKGFLNGSQSYLNFLPEKHTDFIFTLFSEEFGFVGSMIVLLLYFFITYRIVQIGTITRSIFGRLYCYGFATAFFIYVTVNMSMVLGLLPIVGAPLPILSYGGSSMLAIMFGLGIVMSCRIFKDKPFS